MNYNFNVTKFISDYLPPLLRRPKRKAWIETLLKTFYGFVTMFLAFIQSCRYEVSITGQVTILQMYLNNALDITLRRILIIDRSQIGVYIWSGNENQAYDYVYSGSETPIKQIFLRSQSEQPSTVESFIVRVPSVLGLTEIKIRAYIDKYKIAGVAYIVEFV